MDDIIIGLPSLIRHHTMGDNFLLGRLVLKLNPALTEGFKTDAFP